MPKFTGVLALTLLIALTGCFRTNVVYNDAAGSGRADIRKYRHSMIGGFVNLSGALNVGSKCPNGVARVATRVNWLTFVAGTLTGGIYTPSRVRVWCISSEREGGKAEQNVNQEVHINIGRDELREHIGPTNNSAEDVDE